ncbi:hypothetical protein E2C01_005921 [Portunus trituberculatus]|uniref:Uncharacterized protein n=1 Tax=Portunus trituberculatus TaxID=210409 RepID=A0A5B7CVJ5_PORTR|nr:hypothetical protein [Portunus trituberculatus]
MTCYVQYDCRECSPPCGEEASRLSAEIKQLTLAHTRVTPQGFLTARLLYRASRHRVVVEPKGAQGTMTRFHIHPGYYLVISQLQKLMWGIKIVKTVVINLLTSIEPS